MADLKKMRSAMANRKTRRVDASMQGKARRQTIADQTARRSTQRKTRTPLKSIKPISKPLKRTMPLKAKQIAPLRRTPASSAGGAGVGAVVGAMVGGATRKTAQRALPRLSRFKKMNSLQMEQTLRARKKK